LFLENDKTSRCGFRVQLSFGLAKQLENLLGQRF
jgi:hypothetical protein